MKITRKDFLRLSGLGLLALAGKKAVRAVGERSFASSSPPKKRVRWAWRLTCKMPSEGWMRPLH